MKKAPPAFALRFLRWFCREDFIDEIEGDLIEIFEDQSSHSPGSAQRSFIWQVLLHFRPDYIKSFKTRELINSAMFRHNLLISYRSMLRHKRSFFINLLGLSTGLACALLIFLWVQDEMKMDKFHENDQQLYQVFQKYPWPDGIKVQDWTPGPLAQAMKESLPEVAFAVSVKESPHWLDGILSYQDEYMRLTPKYVEKDYLKIFTFPLIAGDEGNLFENKFSVVISEEVASRLFNSPQEAIGKTIQWEKKVANIVDYSNNFTISGVLKSIPKHSTVQFDLLFSYDLFSSMEPNINLWANDQAATFVMLNSGANVEVLNQKITKLIEEKRGGDHPGFLLKQFSSNYLYDRYENGVQKGGRIEYVWLFAIIAILILMIAIINFMNLSTARASIRLKEIGVKKTMGASKWKIATRFITESMLLSFFAFLIATFLVSLILPQFNLLTGKDLSLYETPKVIWWFVGISFMTGLIASLYPAFYLAGIDAIRSLKGNLKANMREILVRKGLVVFQFAISVIFILSVLVIYSQIKYILSKDVGYDRTNLIVIKKEGALEGKLPYFLSEVRNLPGVFHATNSNTSIVDIENFTSGIDWDGRLEDELMRINVFNVNFDFLETFEIKLEEGRSFSQKYGGDTMTVILNKAAVERMGIEAPIGKMITFWRDNVQIIGVTEDFHYQSLYHEVKPCIFRLFRSGENFGDHIWVKIKEGQAQEAIAGIEELYADVNPGYPFSYTYLEDEYNTVYASESRVAMLAKYFTGLAIIISALGLLGLAGFSAERRTKEIGIRKVLGSSAWEIVSLLSKDFIKMVLLAIMIGLPVAYLILDNWLANFAYKIELSVWYFILAAFLTIFIAWSIVGIQSFKASRLDPVLSLKNE